MFSYHSLHFNIAQLLKATQDLQAAQEEAKVAAEEAQRAKKQATEVAWLFDAFALLGDVYGLYHMNQSYVIGLNMFDRENDVISTHTIACIFYFIDIQHMHSLEHVWVICVAI